MASHVSQKNRKYVKDSMIGVLVSGGYLPRDYRGDLDNELLEIDSLGVFSVALDLEDKLDMDISDEDIKEMFGTFEMDVTGLNDHRNGVRASKVVDYISEKLE